MIRLVKQQGVTVGKPGRVTLLTGGRGPTGAQGASPDVSVYKAATVSPVAGVLTLDVSLATTFHVLLTGDVTSIVFSGWRAAPWVQRIEIVFIQDGVGGRAVAGWPAGSCTPDGQEPLLSSAPNAEDVVVVANRPALGRYYVTLVATNYLPIVT